MERRDSRLKWYFHAIAYGFVPAAIAKTTLAPLERIKLILQTQDISNLPVHERYRGVAHYLSSVPSREGFFGYWRGNCASLLSIFSSTSMKFWIGLRIRNIIIRGSKEKTTFEKMLLEWCAGWITGTLIMTWAYPFDLARTRMAGDFGIRRHRIHASSWSCIKSAFDEHKIKGAYQGYMISVATMGPYLGLAFYLHEEIRQWMENNEQSEYKEIGKYFSAGSLAGLAAETLFYPLDTIKRKLQISKSEGYTEGYDSILSCVKGTLKSQGVRGFYRGVLVNVVKVVPTIGINFAVYDYFQAHQIEFKVRKASS
ncbi:unnamed protein product [Blepharisma stoltei]|uniref:Mitochondrial carrier protein n=1 Tax=Blepharisma stoltei TaxID=1481888 RepID=A0AAU9JKL2_9CILI|nr:unnamed protein product [Blepharisma stoltei]